jgi:hypothetical protein
MWMPSVELFECGLKFGGQKGGLEPSSNQAGSGEQFKRRKSISVEGPLFHKQVRPLKKCEEKDRSVRCLDEPPNSYSCIAPSLHVFLTLIRSLALVAVVVV